MAQEPDEITRLRQDAQARAFIESELVRRYATEDDSLRAALEAGKAAGMPAIQISPLQGKLLQVLAAACGARKILGSGRWRATAASGWRGRCHRVGG